PVLEAVTTLAYATAIIERLRLGNCGSNWPSASQMRLRGSVMRAFNRSCLILSSKRRTKWKVWRRRYGDACKDGIGTKGIEVLGAVRVKPGPCGLRTSAAEGRAKSGPASVATLAPRISTVLPKSNNSQASGTSHLRVG